MEEIAVGAVPPVWNSPLSIDTNSPRIRKTCRSADKLLKHLSVLPVVSGSSLDYLANGIAPLLLTGGITLAFQVLINGL
jgi:hypothetical protein